ncbi:hypothetical protein PsAD14_02610 [Pseudovibrio sp. Ad14]|nr:hypothetical protein PsW74_03821 [Pseudovibrio sp. W74]KZL08667.1 hypothetical protein PsAD14_02610 [Pseudovibrio sp. Ad14]
MCLEKHTLCMSTFKSLKFTYVLLTQINNKLLETQLIFDKPEASLTIIFSKKTHTKLHFVIFSYNNLLDR